jgi:ligand-binding sensor domain-containing protein
MRFKNNTLYTVGGGYSADGDVQRPGTVQLFDGDEWTFLQDDVKDNFLGTDGSSWLFVDNLCVDVDPLDSKHVFAAGRTGLYEYYDGQLQTYWSKMNSILKTASSSNKYNIIEGMSFDSEGNLWLVQSQVENSLIKITKDGQWVKLDQSALMQKGSSLPALASLFVDSRGLIWMANDHWGLSSFYCYNPQTDQMVNSFTTLTNQDGTTYKEYRPHCITEDLEGNIWVGTKFGPYLVEKDNITATEPYVTQVKVPRNDGTNYADYLLSGANISAIAIDGGGRKWIATYGTGVYLISADNMNQLANFTKDNSPLLSDYVESVAINQKTGEVFFGTDQGLCSYISDATEASPQMIKDEVYAYPNPVVADYDGLITVVGLSFDADVKILSVNGQLVAQGRSNGGTFTWNGRDRQGRRVASGVYMVTTATSDGKKGTVCKIAVIR